VPKYPDLNGAIGAAGFIKASEEALCNP